MSDEAIVQAPPMAVESEQNVLGILLCAPHEWDRVCGFLAEEDFFRSDHRVIWLAIGDCIEAGDPVDALSVADKLSQGERLDLAGGLEYIAGLANAAGATVNLMWHAKRVKDRAVMRRLAVAAMDISAIAYGPAADPADAAERCEAAILKVLDGQAKEVETVTLADTLEDAGRWLDNPTKGVSTGFPALDKTTGGLREGELVIIAGRPSMGKSALAMCIAEHVAREHSVVVFSLEMNARQISARALKFHRSNMSRIDADHHLRQLRLRINDSSHLTIGGLRLRLRRLHRQHGLRLVVVDYLQLMSGPQSAENRTQEIAAISRALKGIAKEFRCTVIAVSQLSRGPESRTDRRPLLSDLRESGQVEQDADVVVMVYRDDYYDQDSQWKGIVEALVRKNRDGETGTVYLGWRPEFARMVTFSGRLPEREPPKKSKVTSIDRYAGVRE